MFKPISDEQVATILRLREEGFPLKIIAHEANVHKATVSNYLRKNGITHGRLIGRKTHRKRECLKCLEVQVVSVGNQSKICRKCEDDRKRGLWQKVEKNASR